VIPVGDETTGTITLTASDRAPIAMTLLGSAVRDSPGRRKLSGLGEQRLRRMAARSHRVLRFSVRFPDGGTPPSPTTGDNAYQGSAAEVDFRWTSRAL